MCYQKSTSGGVEALGACTTIGAKSVRALRVPVIRSTITTRPCGRQLSIMASLIHVVHSMTSGLAPPREQHVSLGIVSTPCDTGFRPGQGHPVSGSYRNLHFF